ncbi:MAG: alpha/beta fold hydrolase [Planctomycetaceae bacterium]|nr:alpha/beta fold hydrolase [Planctomycetaceae bacterium]
MLCDRDGQGPRTGFQSTLYRRLARIFAERGIATFRYDKRQFDWPAPKPLTYTLTDRVNDLTAACNAMKSQPEVDPVRLAIVGHSEGGIVAQLAAMGVKPARIAVLASPAVSLLETMSWRVRRNRMAKTVARRQSGIVQQQGVDELIHYVESGHDFTPDEFEEFKAKQSSKSAIQGWESWPWIKEHHRTRITETTAKLPCPSLFIHGDHDNTVSIENLERYRKAAAGVERNDIICETMVDLGHFLEDTTRKAFTVSETLVDRVARWVTNGQ